MGSPWDSCRPRDAEERPKAQPKVAAHAGEHLLTPRREVATPLHLHSVPSCHPTPPLPKGDHVSLVPRAWVTLAAVAVQGGLVHGAQWDKISSSAATSGGFYC